MIIAVICIQLYIAMQLLVRYHFSFNIQASEGRKFHPVSAEKKEAVAATASSNNFGIVGLSGSKDATPFHFNFFHVQELWGKHLY